MTKQSCSRCGKIFESAEAVKRHVNAKHGGNGIAIQVAARDDAESFADRAIKAEMDIAMGFGSDDAWLLP